MSNDVFDGKILAEKLSKLNNSQQSIESLSRWCISNRKKARQIVETWEKMFNPSQREKCVSFLYLANDILQNSRRKGNEFVNEFWKVLPAALKHVYDTGDESGKKAANRLVDIWEERKVFGSRVQSLKDELATIQTKDPAPQVVSNGKMANPIKIVKRDAQSLRIKVAVGELPEKIMSAFLCLHDECSNETSMLVKCNATAHSVERLLKEVESATSQGIQPGNSITDEMQEQENVLQQCVRQLEGAEATRATLVSLLKEAVQDQEVQLETLRHQLQIARSQINEIGILKPNVSSHDHGASAEPVRALTESTMMGAVNNSALQSTNTLQIPPSQPIGSQQISVNQVPQIPATSFSALAATDDENKKAAAAAVAAKLAASTSSAQMLTSVLSSLVAQEAASMNDSFRKVGFSANMSMFSPEKRQKLEQPSSGVGVTNLDAGSSPYFAPLQQQMSSNPASQSSIQGSLGPPPPPPPSLLPNNAISNQFTQSAGMMMNMMPYGFGSNNLPPPPPLPSHVAMGLSRPPTPQSSQPLQPPQQLAQPLNASGGFYRPPGICLYGSSSQPSTSVQRQ